MPTRLHLSLATACVLLLGAVGLAGCPDGTGGPASAGGFRPRAADALTVATSDLPVPGFWTGPPAEPDGGFEHDLAAALADRFGLEAVTVVEVPFDDLIGGDLGGADLALAQLTPTSEHDRHLDFSGPYLPAPPGVLVSAGTDVADLYAARRLDWAVQEATTLARILEAEVRPASRPRRADSLSRLVELVRRGQVDAALVDLPTALATAARSGGALAVAAQLPGSGTLAAALPDGSRNRAAVDAALRRLTADGTLDALAEEWLGTHWRGGSPDVPVVRTHG